MSVHVLQASCWRFYYLQKDAFINLIRNILHFTVFRNRLSAFLTRVRRKTILAPEKLIKEAKIQQKMITAKV